MLSLYQDYEFQDKKRKKETLVSPLLRYIVYNKLFLKKVPKNAKDPTNTIKHQMGEDKHHL